MVAGKLKCDSEMLLCKGRRIRNIQTSLVSGSTGSVQCTRSFPGGVLVPPLMYGYVTSIFLGQYSLRSKNSR